MTAHYIIKSTAYRLDGETFTSLKMVKKHAVNGINHLISEAGVSLTTPQLLAISLHIQENKERMVKLLSIYTMPDLPCDKSQNILDT